MSLVSWCLVKNMAVGCRLSQSSAGWRARCLPPPSSHRSLITGRWWETRQGNSPGSSHISILLAFSLPLLLYSSCASEFVFSFFSVCAIKLVSFSTFISICLSLRKFKTALQLVTTVSKVNKKAWGWRLACGNQQK